MIVLAGYKFEEDKNKVFTPQELLDLIKEKAHPFLIEACMIHNEYGWGFEPIIGEVIKIKDDFYYFKEQIGEHKLQYVEKEGIVEENGMYYRNIPLLSNDVIMYNRATRLKNKPYVRACLIYGEQVEDNVDYNILIDIVNDETSRRRYIDTILLNFLKFSQIDTLAKLKVAMSYSRKMQQALIQNPEDDIFKTSSITIPNDKEKYYNKMEKITFAFLEDTTLIDTYYMT